MTSFVPSVFRTLEGRHLGLERQPTMWRKVCNFVFLFFFIAVTSAKPNVLIFLVDDLGIADVGCFGNDTIKTPNIDRLAEEGARLRHDVTPDSICTPNRAAFLTGRYPIRSGLASDQNQIRVFIFTAAYGGLPQNETTFAEIASTAGYRTGLVYFYNPLQSVSKFVLRYKYCWYKLIPSLGLLGCNRIMFAACDQVIVLHICTVSMWGRGRGISPLG